MFQNGIKAIEEVLEVATYSPKHSFVFFKAEAKELFTEMLSQLTEWHSWENGDAETPMSVMQNCTLMWIHTNCHRQNLPKCTQSDTYTEKKKNYIWILAI